MKYLVLLALAACGHVADNGACLPGSMLCDDACVDLQTDSTDCGACGHACGASEACVAGVCAVQCPSGFASCGTTCADLDHDDANCGACGTVCGPAEACVDQACVGQQWEALPLLLDSHIPGFTDFTPTGQSVFFDVSGSITYSTATNGMQTHVAPPPASIPNYTMPAWVGTKLYVTTGANVYVYDVTQNVWTTPVITLTHPTSENQATGDDHGFVYTTSSDINLIAIKIADNTVTYTPEPATLTASEPRAAWDTSTQRLYLADYSHAPLYAYNPTDQSFTPLASIPPGTTSDAFCGDRTGHLFSASSDCDTVATIWMYTIATDTWSEMASPPFVHGCNASCTVMNGYLYFAAGDGYFQARIKL